MYELKEISSNSKIMSESISYVRMEPAENGCIIRYNERVPVGTYDYNTKECTEVFQFKPGDKAGMMKAMQRFCELGCGEEKEMNGKDKD